MDSLKEKKIDRARLLERSRGTLALSVFFKLRVKMFIFIILETYFMWVESFLHNCDQFIHSLFNALLFLVL